jgi:hypothetical protein
MNLTIQKCPSKKFLPYVNKAINYYAESLIPNKNLRNNIYLDLRFDKKINVLGYASIVYYNASNKPRWFLIEVHPQIGASMIFRVLAHEIAHVKQFIYGEINENLSVWKNEPIDSDNLDYWDHPWEIEAHGLEESLYNKFVKKEKLWNIFEDIPDPQNCVPKTTIRWRLDRRKKVC